MKGILFLVAILFSSYAFGQENIPLVSVTGEGIVKVVPDQVIIRAGVVHTGSSAAEVKSKNAAVMNDIFKFMESKGIPSENIQTEYLRLNKQYNYDTKEFYYSASQSISVELKSLNTYEEIMSGLMETGLNRIDGIKFQTSKKEELEAQARKEAMLDAREKATQLASAVGLTIGNAFSIHEMNMDPVQPVFRMAEMKAMDSGAEQTIAPGQMKIKVRVDVSFLLHQEPQGGD